MRKVLMEEYSLEMFIFFFYGVRPQCGPDHIVVPLILSIVTVFINTTFLNTFFATNNFQIPK